MRTIKKLMALHFRKILEDVYQTGCLLSKRKRGTETRKKNIEKYLKKYLKTKYAKSEAKDHSNTICLRKKIKNLFLQKKTQKGQELDIKNMSG